MNRSATTAADNTATRSCRPSQRNVSLCLPKRAVLCSSLIFVMVGCLCAGPPLVASFAIVRSNHNFPIHLSPWLATTRTTGNQGTSFTRGIFPITQRFPVSTSVRATVASGIVSSSSSSFSTGDGSMLDTLAPPKPIPSSPASALKVGVLLLNLGGPETSADVEGFLYNLFADPDIIRLPGPLAPLQNVIAYFISKRRAPKSREAYESIGGGSPILKYSKAQAHLLSDALRTRYGMTSVQTYIGMRYWHPFTEEALEQICQDQIQALVIVPLYPQFSISTSGSSLRVLQEEFSRNPSRYGNIVHTVIPSWYDRPGYVQAMTDLIQEQLDSFTEEEIKEAFQAHPEQKPLHVLFSAHGVPQSYIEAGDPYQQQIESCVEQIRQRLYRREDNVQRVDIHLSYQSRVGPIEWLRPYTDDVLPSLGAKGVKNLVVVPISFVSEHVETLEEIDIEYRELAHESGIDNWRRCPALNTNEQFIQDMADMVHEALQSPIQTVTEACVANAVSDIVTAEDIAMTGVQGVGAESGVVSTGSVNAVVGGLGGSRYWTNPNQRKQSELKITERINARVAILGVLLTIAVELINGKSLIQLFSNSS